MRTSVVLGIGVLVLTTGVGPSFGQNPNGLLQSLDANNDGTITRSEVPESAIPAFERVLKSADKNKDGQLDRDELRSMAQRLKAAGPALKAGRPAGAPGAPGAMAERFKQMDTNSDGKVTLKEFTGPEAMFNRLDANKDGAIDKGELPRFAANAEKGAPAPKKDQGGAATTFGDQFKALDKDGDGKISRSEFPQGAAIFERVDLDKDGFITVGEAEKAKASEADRTGPGGETVLQRMRRIDTNRDGKLSREEFRIPDALFDRVDTDKDGLLTPEELRNGREQLQGVAAKKAKKS